MHTIVDYNFARNLVEIFLPFIVCCLMLSDKCGDLEVLNRLRIFNGLFENMLQRPKYARRFDIACRGEIAMGRTLI